MARVARRKTTIYDIATAAEASASTVSLVLNGSWARYRIAEDTAQRVTEAAKRLGYAPNLAARGLRLSRSGLAGMILPHYRIRFFAELAEAFEAEARRRDLCPIVVSTQRDAAVEAQVTRKLLAQRVEFLFIVGVPRPEPLDRLCQAAGVPCVNLDLPGADAPSVVSDNRGGARRLTEAMIGRVLRRGGSLDDLLYLGGVAGEYATDNRVAGFRDAVGARGVALGPGHLDLCGYPPESACDALRSHVERRGRLPSGLFLNSIAAFEGAAAYAASLPAAKRAALRACCFDYDPFAACLPFDVAMLRQDVEAMTRHAFAALAPAAQEARALTLVPAVPAEARVRRPGPRPARAVSADDMQEGVP